jgi:hypothetical protein
MNQKFIACALGCLFGLTSTAMAGPQSLSKISLMKYIDAQPKHTLTVMHWNWKESEFKADPVQKIFGIKLVIPSYRGDGNKLLVDQVNIDLTLRGIDGVYQVVTAHCEVAKSSQNKIVCRSNENEGGENDVTISKVGTKLNIAFKTPYTYASEGPRLKLVESSNYPSSRAPLNCAAGASLVKVHLGDEADANVSAFACGVTLKSKSDMNLRLELANHI